MIKTLMEDIVERIKSFDCDGQQENVFRQLDTHIQNVLGIKAANILSRYMDATDGQFYFKDTATMEACLAEIQAIADKQMQTLSPP